MILCPVFMGFRPFMMYNLNFDGSIPEIYRKQGICQVGTES